MATFVLIPGAGGAAWVLAPRGAAARRGRAHGHPRRSPGDDEVVGLEGCADLVLDAIGARRDVVLVAQSLGGFTAAMVSARAPLSRLVFVNAMIPQPGETAGAWWKNTGWEEARVAAAREEAKIAFTQPCRFEGWPDVPVHVIVGRDDRFFPADFQTRLVRERLPARASLDVIRGGHLAALSNPEGLVDRLLAYLNV